MDGSKVQLKRTGGGAKGPFEIRSIAAHGTRTAGRQDSDMLVAEGHYRCPHCRRAGVEDGCATAKRMR